MKLQFFRTLRLCPYDEEEPAIWFRFIEAQFDVAVIRS
jgi:hypothetical protein